MYPKIRKGLIATFTFSLFTVILGSLWLSLPFLGDKLDGTVFGEWIDNDKNWVFALGWLVVIFGTIGMILSGVAFVKQGKVSQGMMMMIAIIGLICFLVGGILILKGVTERNELTSELPKNNSRPRY